MKLCLALVAALTMAASCAQSIARQGVLLNQLGVSKANIGSSPEGLTTESYVSATRAERVKYADLAGGPELETLRQLEAGRGLEVLDSSGRLLATVKAAHYLTDFGVIHASQSHKPDLVFYGYPSTPDRSGTFSILAFPSQTMVATWDINPATDWFAVGVWKNEEALFYLQGDMLVVRSPFGREVRRLDVPGGRAFARVVQVMTLSDGHTVVLASGDGYTRYHMVSVFDDEGQLKFHEIGKKNAYRLEAPGPTDTSSVWRSSDGSWTVWTQSDRWRYHTTLRPR